jgi:D-amino-acid oxidase
MSRVVVVGAGVVGLSCAVRLLEAGHEVGVVARDLPQETTSSVAAALWYPYRAYPFERVTAWAQTTYDALLGLAEDDRAGVVVRSGTEVLRSPAGRPWWADAVPELRDPTDLPPGYVAGWSFDAPVVEMPIYLDWLVRRIEDLGGTVTRMALSALPDQAEVVVNAAGLGGRLLGADESLMPVRGQVVLVEQVGLEQWWLDSTGPTYVVPRSHDVVVGGTDDEGAWERRPDEAVARDILERARRLVPQLAGARVLKHRVGLRPARPTVRLEERTGARGNRVIHCYGHGGAGVTLSWGCADEVAALVG